MTFRERMVRCRAWRRLAVWASAGVILAAAAVAAEDAAPRPGEETRIRISADRLVFDNNTQSAAFSGNVTAVQGATRITADRLTVFYDTAEADADAGGTRDGEAASIRRIVSEGNVTIRFDDKVAVTRKAIYNKSSGLLELIGEGTRVTSGQNTITGTHITVDRQQDSITVAGGEGRRVEALIYPSQEGDGLLAPSPPGADDGRPTP